MNSQNSVRFIDFTRLPKRKRNEYKFDISSGPTVYSKFTPPMEDEPDDEVECEVPKVYLKSDTPNEYHCYRE